jgi:hypothetical protein
MNAKPEAGFNRELWHKHTSGWALVCKRAGAVRIQTSILTALLCSHTKVQCLSLFDYFVLHFMICQKRRIPRTSRRHQDNEGEQHKRCNQQRAYVGEGRALPLHPPISYVKAANYYIKCC